MITPKRIINLLAIFSLLLILPLTAINAQSAKNKKGTAPKSEQSSSGNIGNTVIAEVGPEQITWNALEQAYRKNMNRKNVELAKLSKDSLMDFFNLYINFRLKVADAINRGFDKDSAVMSDIQQNRKILAESYYFDKKLIEPNVNEMLKLREYEMQFAYVLVAFPSSLPKPDTLSAFNKATEALNKIKGGEDFAKIAQEYSDDKESGQNGGMVPTYITAGKLYRQLENALYSIKKEGNIYPELVKSKFGYFILKLVKKVPRVYVLASQILLSEGLQQDSAAVIRKADSLLTLIKKGANFSKLAEENSDDPASAMKGGSFPDYYSRSTGFEKTGKNVIPAIEEAIFSLKDGEVSGKIVTEYGIHIIRRDSTRTVDENKERDEIKKLYKRLYFEDDKAEMIESLKQKYGFVVYQDVLNKLLASVDTTKSNLDTAWIKAVPSDLMDRDLFALGAEKTKLKDFVKALTTTTELRGLPNNTEGFKKAMNKMVQPKVMLEATKNLEGEYPEFAALMREFRDGILLFRVEAIEVWEKLKFDTVTARKFWDTTKTRYKTDPLYDLTEIYVLTDTLANQIYTKAKAGEDFEELAAANTQRSGFREKKGKMDNVSVKNNDFAKLVDQAGAKPGDILPPKAYDKGFTIIKVNAFKPVRMKTFEEAISDFAPAYQDQLQKYYQDTWLNKIRAKFPVKIFSDKIKKISQK